MKQDEIFNMLHTPELSHYFEEMSRVHMYTKHYLLIAEEIADAGVAFLQPLKEHRDAYDHLMRIFALTIKEIPMTARDAQKYVLDNVKKAFGHEYRAFFDTADWLTYICRKSIREELSYRGRKELYKNKFEDYEEIKEFINELPFLIAKYREEKDVSNYEPILKEVLEYKKTLDKLLDIYKRIKML